MDNKPADRIVAARWTCFGLALLAAAMLYSFPRPSEPTDRFALVREKWLLDKRTGCLFGAVRDSVTESVEWRAFVYPPNGYAKTYEEAVYGIRGPLTKAETDALVSRFKAQKEVESLSPLEK